MFQEFRQFLFRGNVVDLAVEVVIGAAFGAVVTALVKDLVTPLIAAIFGQPNFAGPELQGPPLAVSLRDFINTVVAFVLVAAGVFWTVVTPMKLMSARIAKPAPASAPTTKQCPECCSQIPLAAHRCAFCASPQP